MGEVDYSLLQRAAQRARLGGGGGGPHDPGMEARVTALEADMREIKGVLGRMEPLLRSIDDRLGKVETRLTTLDGKVASLEASYARLGLDVAELKGKVSQLPDTWQMIVGAVGFIGLTFAVLRFGLP